MTTIHEHVVGFLGGPTLSFVSSLVVHFALSLCFLEGQNPAIDIAESLARVIAAIRMTSVRWQSYLIPKAQKSVLVDNAFLVLRFESRDWRSLV